MNPTPITLGGSNVFRDMAEGAVVYVPTIEAETAYEADGIPFIYLLVSENNLIKLSISSLLNISSTSS